MAELHPSQLRMAEEWEMKHSKIASEMSTRKYRDVNEDLKARPNWKSKEFSKQHVSDGDFQCGGDGEWRAGDIRLEHRRGGIREARRSWAGMRVWDRPEA